MALPLDKTLINIRVGVIDKDAGDMRDFAKAGLGFITAKKQHS